MATLTCAVHGPQDGGPLCPVPGCMNPLRPAPPPPPVRPAVATCGEPGCDTPLDAAGRCAIHSLGGLADEVAASTPSRFRLVFPWGATLPVGGEVVRVGRSADAGVLAGPLDSYDTVSRRHAEIRMDGDRLVVRDVGSANGTFVNDRRLVPSADHEVHAGDVLSFSSTLRVEVREQP